MNDGKLLDVDFGVGGITTSVRPRPLGDDLHSETMVVNLGPAHPATHGTIRIVAELSGEKIVDADIDLGYLHRGFEKMSETVDYNQVMPYTDRLNYVSPAINNFGWCLTIEKLLQIKVPKRAQYVSYGRVGGVKEDLTAGFADRAKVAFKKVRDHLVNCDRLLTRNRIFIDRMCNIAVLTAEEAINLSLTGPMLRGSGVKHDLRKASPYSSYEDFEFDVPVGSKGDNYDRFLVRFAEMEESLKICEQALAKLPEGPIAVSDPHVTLVPKDEAYNSIDGMINHFELVMYGVKPPKGSVYNAIEGANGELGFYVVSDGTGKPYRAHVRSPSFIHMGSMRKMILGANISDIVPTFGMINMIGGECDR